MLWLLGPVLWLKNCLENPFNVKIEQPYTKYILAIGSDKSIVIPDGIFPSQSGHKCVCGSSGTVQPIMILINIIINLASVYKYGKWWRDGHWRRSSTSLKVNTHDGWTWCIQREKQRRHLHGLPFEHDLENNKNSMTN